MTTVDDIDRARRAGVSLNAQIEEVRRELAMRAQVYPGLIHRHKLRQSVADEYVRRMEAVLDTLELLREEQRSHVPDHR